MTVIGDAIRRGWGEAVWTARDLLRPQRVTTPPLTIEKFMREGAARPRFGDATASAIGEQELEQR